MYLVSITSHSGPVLEKKSEIGFSETMAHSVVNTSTPCVFKYRTQHIQPHNGLMSASGYLRFPAFMHPSSTVKD